jgi:hypothetical protein
MGSPMVVRLCVGLFDMLSDCSELDGRISPHPQIKQWLHWLTVSRSANRNALQQGGTDILHVEIAFLILLDYGSSPSLDPVYFGSGRIVFRYRPIIP